MFSEVPGENSCGPDESVNISSQLADMLREARHQATERSRGQEGTGRAGAGIVNKLFVKEWSGQRLSSWAKSIPKVGRDS